MWKAEGSCWMQGEAGAGDLVSTLFFSPVPMLAAPLHGPGGTLWSHLLSKEHPQPSGLKSGSGPERMKASLNSPLSLQTPALLPLGPARLQDRILLEPPRTSQSLPQARGAPAIDPQREAAGSPSARTQTFCPPDLLRAPSGRLHLQARRGPGRSSEARPSWGLPWVHQGAVRVLGACSRGKSPSHPLADGAHPGFSRGAWHVNEEQVRQWAAETLVALEALHEQGVLCRDLNPRNLLLDQTGRCPAWGGGDLPRLSEGVPGASRQRRGVPQSRGDLRGYLLPLPPPGLFTQDSDPVWLADVEPGKRALPQPRLRGSSSQVVSGPSGARP